MMVSCPPPEPIKPPAIVQYSRNPAVPRPVLRVAKKPVARKSEIKVLCSNLEEASPPVGSAGLSASSTDRAFSVVFIEPDVPMYSPVPATSTVDPVVPTPRGGVHSFQWIPNVPTYNVTYIAPPVVSEPATALTLLLGLVVFTLYKRNVLHK